MKKLFTILILTATLIWASGCDYDDSNDIDILKPNDSTETNIDIREIPD